MTDRPTEQTGTRLADRLADQAADAAEAPAERTAVRPAVPADVPQSVPPSMPATNGTALNGTATHGAPPVAPPSPSVQPTPQPAIQPTTQPTPAPARATKTAKAKPKRPPRRARLRLTRVDPWSVMKTAFLLSIALGIVTIVSVLMVWSVLSAAGVWDSINSAVRDIVGEQDGTPFTIQDYLGTDRVIGFTMLVAVIDVVLLTAIATLGAFLYNMAAALLGGLDITLVEDEH